MGTIKRAHLFLFFLIIPLFLHKQIRKQITTELLALPNKLLLYKTILKPIWT
jgi:hypothetical protein